MQNKLKIFGEYRNVVIGIKPKSDPKGNCYKFSADNKTITLLPWEYTDADLLIKHVYKHIFLNVLVSYIWEIKKEIVPKASFNKIEFKKSQSMSIKTTYITKENNITGLTDTLCSKCKNPMALKINKKTGTKFLGCSKFPKCKNIEWLNQNHSDKSKNGYYIYCGPNLIKYSFETIKAKVIFNLISTYYKIYSKEFMEELNKLCPKFWELHSYLNLNEIKKAIKQANSNLSKEEIVQIMGYLEVRKDLINNDKQI